MLASLPMQSGEELKPHTESPELLSVHGCWWGQESLTSFPQPILALPGGEATQISGPLCSGGTSDPSKSPLKAAILKAISEAFSEHKT